LHRSVVRFEYRGLGESRAPFFTLNVIRERGVVKRLFHIACAPRPGVEMTMSKDDAALKIADAFVERYPDCLIIMTFIGHVGDTWSFMISVSDDERKKK